LQTQRPVIDVIPHWLLEGSWDQSLEGRTHVHFLSLSERSNVGAGFIGRIGKRKQAQQANSDRDKERFFGFFHPRNLPRNPPTGNPGSQYFIFSPPHGFPVSGQSNDEHRPRSRRERHR
jgi:hypothetical protein